METKHTPGKWINREVPPNGTYSPPRRRFQITDEHDKIGICTVNISASCPNEEAEANANLITGAPEILKRIKETNDVLNMIISNPENNLSEKEIELMEAAVRENDLVVIKAEGGQP